MILYSLPIDSHYPLRKAWDQYNSGLEIKIAKIVSPEPLCPEIRVRDVYDVFFYTQLSVSERNRVHYRVTLYYAYSRIFAGSSLMAGVFFLTIVFYVFGHFKSPEIINWLSIIFLESLDFLFKKLLIACLLNIGIALITVSKAVSELTGATSFEGYLISYHKDQLIKIFSEVLRTRTRGTGALQTNNQNKEENLQRACDMENFKMVAEHFRQDVREFWTRANFYLLAHAALFSAFVVVYPSLIKDQIIVVILVPVFGVTIAVFWFGVLRGSVYWIKQWRTQVIKLSKELDRFRCYAEVENLVNQEKMKSPSYLTQFLPLVFVVIWSTMLVIAVLRVFAIF
jgi:hypothetical protein